MESILITSFHEALNAVSQPITKGKQFADSMSNVILSTRNAVAKKPGTEPINLSAYASGSEILSIYDFLFQQGDTVRKNIFNAGTQLFELHANSGVAGVIKSGLSPLAFQYEVSRRTLYMGNGKEMLKYYSLAGYSLFADLQAVLDETNTSLAQSFVSLHGRPRTCASVSIAIRRNGAIPASTKVTIEIQGDSSGPDGTPIANGTSQQINGDDIAGNWESVSFTFATMPTITNGVTYWIVLKTSVPLTSGLDLFWGVDNSNPTYIGGQFARFNVSWTLSPTQDALFQVFVEPDNWGIIAPTTAPNLTPSSINNPAYDTPGDQDADEELTDAGLMAQSWKFTGNEDRTVSSIQLFLKKNGAPGGNLGVSIHNDDGNGLPASSALAKSSSVSASSLGAAYGFITFTLLEDVTLSQGVKFWIQLNSDQLYRDSFVTGVTSVDWGVDASAPTYADGEFARFVNGTGWTLDSGRDLLFRIVSSLMGSGGRKYKVSWRNAVTGHISNSSPATAASGNVNSALIDTLPTITDIQVDRVIIWATNDGGSAYFKLTEIDWNVASFDDNPIDDDDLDTTQIAPEDNAPPPKGGIIARYRDSIIVTGVRQNPQSAFYSAGLGQTLLGVREESFPALNFMDVPAGSERIYQLGSIDGAPLAFSNDQIFTVAGEPDSYRMVEIRGGKSVGSVSRLGGVSTEFGYFFFGSNRRVYLIPTISHIPEIVSAIVEDVFEAMTFDSPLLEINSIEKLRMTYLDFADRHWVIITFATGASSTLNNEMWVYDLDLHREHPGKAWFGPIALAGGQGFQSLKVITRADHSKALYIGDEGGFIREFGSGNQDGGANFSSSYTFPWMDDNKPDIVKDGLTVELIVPSGQTIPANFLQVSYDSQSNFENVALDAVNEMERGTSSHKYRGSLMRQFTRIQPRINFASEDAVGELWSLRIDYEPLFSTRGFIHDA